jgi:hypothetical protein
MNEGKGRDCGVLLFPREAASWPQHYLSHVFFYDRFNLHFKNPLFEFFSIFFPRKRFFVQISRENQDLSVAVLSRLDLKKK